MMPEYKVEVSAELILARLREIEAEREGLATDEVDWLAIPRPTTPLRRAIWDAQQYAAGFPGLDDVTAMLGGLITGDWLYVG